MSEPDREPTEKPTTSKEEAESEGKWMARNGIAIGVVSILALVVLMIGAMQATGLVDVLAPFAETAGAQWGVFFVMALVVIILGGWSWKAIA
ncbi:hypothetical protein [Haloterrigena alkaliphila]|uniref:Uncharacterized protein n=1 Tax=Haloterrigena alkaliphila TaxID=2816475 RepID=A0A8A2VNV6_9EURY|nr:hypothetical protein [Haloterrigena alkaliphila]QSW99798.1 hypothetical protein J0X25_02215 [Haloterrigena alkaliphila]